MAPWYKSVNLVCTTLIHVFLWLVACHGMPIKNTIICGCTESYIIFTKIESSVKIFVMIVHCSTQYPVLVMRPTRKMFFYKMLNKAENYTNILIRLQNRYSNCSVHLSSRIVMEKSCSWDSC